MTLTQPVHVAGNALSVIRLVYDACDDGTLDHIAEDKVIERYINQLATALEHFSLKEIARDLDSDSRGFYLMIILRLSSFVTIATNPASGLNHEDRLALHIHTLEGTHKYISLFDEDLGRQFAEDGEMSVANRGAH